MCVCVRVCVRTCKYKDMRNKRAHMVRMGATYSKTAINTPTSARATVKRRAKVGSFRKVLEKNLRKGIMLSKAMACRRRGAL